MFRRLRPGSNIRWCAVLTRRGCHNIRIAVPKLARMSQYLQSNAAPYARMLQPSAPVAGPAICGRTSARMPQSERPRITLLREANMWASPNARCAFD